MLQSVNPALLRMWRLHHEREVLGQECSVLWKDAERAEPIMAELIGAGTWTGEREAIRRDGTTFPVEVTATVVRDQHGQPICLMSALSDVTERKRADQDRRKLQAQLLQAQKLESLGRLAGGVAHDFNNLLTVILSHCDMAAARIDAGHPLQAAFKGILDAGERAAALTRQLLAFSHKQVLELQVVPLNAVIEQIMRMLTRIIGEDIVMELRLASKRSILADAVQVGQIIMNLAVNSRDAMAGGGRLVIETADVDLDAGDARLIPRSPRVPTCCSRCPTPAPASPPRCWRGSSTLLHDQGAGEGDRAGAGHRLRHRRAAPGDDRGLERARPGHHVPHLPPRGGP